MSTSDHVSTSGRSERHRSVPSPVRKAAAVFQRVALMVLVATPLLLSSAHGLAADGDMKWPEATAQLASLRTKAETCVALLKRYGSPGEKAQGRLSYADAKGDIDAVITGLTTALATNGRPGSLPSLQDRLNRGSASLLTFCGAAHRVSPSTAGHKGLVDEIAKSAIEPLVKAVSNGVAALYSNYRDDAALTRKTIQTQLEASRWLDFDQVPLAQ